MISTHCQQRKYHLASTADHRNICVGLGIKPTRSNIRRASKACAILASNRLEFVKLDSSGSQTYRVKSQRSNNSYNVRLGKLETFCECLDWQKEDRKLSDKGVPFSTHACKHGIAARLDWQEFITPYVQWATVEDQKAIRGE